MKVRLIVLSAGSAAGQAIPVSAAQFIIGRDPQCNLRPGSVMISKRHCAILVRDKHVFLRDFDSTNGTFLNEQPVKGEVPLKDGDVLKVGPLSFKVAIEVPAPAAAPTKPTPPPKPRRADIMDEDAAALLLDSNDGVSIQPAVGDTADAVPDGTTLMDIPAPAAPEEPKPAATKLVETKKKPAVGDAQNAARAILEKLKQGKRK